jgi:DNA-binding NarL/FixJ family response regulator
MNHAAGAKMKRSERTVRILIADDHPVVRRAVRTTLEQHSGFEVCAEAQDGAKAIEEAEKLKPDVVVLNVSMPVLSGFEAAREIKTRLPETAIVMLSSNADQRFVEEAKKIGARAYVAKTRAAEDLVKAIETAVKGGDFVFVG